MPISFKICINLVQFTWSNIFCHSMKPACNSSSMRKFILILFWASQQHLYSFSSSKSNWSSPSTSSIFFTNPLLSILATIFVVCVRRLIVWWWLHFVTFGFLFMAIILTSVKSLAHFPVTYMLFISCVPILRTFPLECLSIYPCTKSSSAAFLSLTSLTDFSTSLCKR